MYVQIAHANLKATVKHAQTCVVDDKQIYLFFPPSPESRMGVVFNVVGETKGLIVDSHYVTNNILSEAEKVFFSDDLPCSFYLIHFS